MIGRDHQDPLSLHERRGVALVALLVLVVAGGAVAFLLSTLDGGFRRNSVNPDVFTDGIGIYLFNDGKYNMLVWKKKIVGGSGQVPEQRDILEASQQAVLVGPGVRFFAYGMDFSKWPAVPPYVMAFCIVRDERTIDGIYPIRLKLVDQTRGPIYELLLPPVIDNLRSGALNSLFWVVNFQYSCNDGWVFKFARSK